MGGGVALSEDGVVGSSGMGGGVSDGVGGDDGEAAGMLYRHTGQRATKVGQSESTSRVLSERPKGSVKMDSTNQIAVVDEEGEDVQDSSNLDSSQKQIRSSRSKKSKESSMKKTASIEESLTDLEDKEILESTQSV